MNILEIIILGVFILSLFSGYKNGFLKTVFSLISWVIVFAVCNAATPMVTELLIEKTEIDTTIQFILDAKIDEVLSNAIEEATAVDFVSESEPIVIPEELQSVLPEEVKKLLSEGMNIADITLPEGMMDTSSIVYNILEIISLLLVMVVVRVALIVVEAVLGIASKLPLIGPLDKMLGFICGAGKGLIWSWVILVAVTVLALTGINMELAGCISESQFLTWLQDNNILVKLIVE